MEQSQNIGSPSGPIINISVGAPMANQPPSVVAEPPSVAENVNSITPLETNDASVPTEEEEPKSMLESIGDSISSVVSDVEEAVTAVSSGVSSTPEGEEAAVEGEETPVEGEQPPVEGEEAPVEEEKTLVEGDVEPSNLSQMPLTEELEEPITKNAEQAAVIASLERRIQDLEEKIGSFEEIVSKATGAASRAEDAAEKAEAAVVRVEDAMERSQEAIERSQEAAERSQEAAERSQESMVSLNEEPMSMVDTDINDFQENETTLGSPLPTTNSFQPAAAVKQGKVLTELEVKRQGLRGQETQHLNDVFSERFSWIPEKDRPKAMQADIAKLTATTLRSDPENHEEESEEKERLKQSIIQKSLLSAARRYLMKMYNKDHPTKKLSDSSAISDSMLNPLITSPEDAPYKLEQLLQGLEKKTYSVKSITRHAGLPRVSYTRGERTARPRHTQKQKRQSSRAKTRSHKKKHSKK